jgi:hypothetical protein
MKTGERTVPLIIRGEVISENATDYARFASPSAGDHLDRLVLRDPMGLRDLHSLRTSEVIDYFVELGERLDLDTNPHLQHAVAMAEGVDYTAAMLESQYRSFDTKLRREMLEEYVEESIGAEYLDGWVETELRDRRIAVRAFGARAVHVIAGNSPHVALQSMITNALARSDQIVKIPANEPYAATAIALTMIEMAPDHPITRHLSVAYWKGGEASVERRLYDPRNIEKIVAWGGFASMQSIRNYLAPGLDLIALDPKLSASLIGAEVFSSEDTLTDAATRAARDVGYYNQGGCASARVIYVESGTDAAGIARANEFGERLFAAVQALPPDVSSLHPAFDPVLRAEIAGLRHVPGFKVIGGRDNEGAVIVSQQEEPVDFADRLNCRVANVVPVDSIRDALRYLTIHTQTIGIYPDALKSELRDECVLRGGQQIVPLGAATAKTMAGPHDAMYVLSRMVRWMRDDTITAAVPVAVP